MDRTRKIVVAATNAYLDGYEYMYSVVKSYYGTTYYHINSTAEIIMKGKWIPAPKGEFPSASGTGTWKGRAGSKHLPASAINKSEAIRKYCK